MSMADTDRIVSICLALAKESMAGTAAVAVFHIFRLQMEQHVLKFAIDYRGRK